MTIDWHNVRVKFDPEKFERWDKRTREAFLDAWGPWLRNHVDPHEVDTVSKMPGVEEESFVNELQVREIWTSGPWTIPGEIWLDGRKRKMASRRAVPTMHIIFRSDLTGYISFWEADADYGQAFKRGKYTTVPVPRKYVRRYELDDIKRALASVKFGIELLGPGKSHQIMVKVA